MTQPHGYPPSHAEWHEAMMNGLQVDVPVDQQRLQSKLRGNTFGFAATLVVAAACSVLLVWIIFTEFGRTFTYVLLGILIGLLLLMALYIRRIRSRLAAARANPTYISVSREGLRIAGSVWVPWSDSVGVLAGDLRNVYVPARQRIAQALHELVGSSQALLVVGLIEERPRSLRSESAPKLKRLFEVISDTGGLRVPLSAVLSEDDTVMALVAVPAAARAAGLEAIWSADKAEIGTATMSLFMSRPISAQMTILSAFEEGLQEAQDEQFIDRLAEAVLNEEGRRVLADARERFGDNADDGQLLLDAGAHPSPETIGWCDAGGEDDPGQVFASVIRACENLGLPAPHLHDGIEAQSTDPVGRLLQQADAGLHQVGLRLLMLDPDSDMYHFAPVTAEQHEKLVGTEAGGLGLRSVAEMVGGPDTL